MFGHRSHLYLLSSCALAGVLGCASTPSPDVGLARASARVEQAQQAGAGEYAAVELQSANTNLQLARTAAEKGKANQARGFAEQAELDAELAEAKTRNQQSAKAAKEVKTGTETLRQEAARASDAAAPPIATAAEEAP